LRIREGFWNLPLEYLSLWSDCDLMMILMTDQCVWEWCLGNDFLRYPLSSPWMVLLVIFDSTYIRVFYLVSCWKQ
jgi:hypothetical protein